MPISHDSLARSLTLRTALQRISHGQCMVNQPNQSGLFSLSLGYFPQHLPAKSIPFIRCQVERPPCLPTPGPTFDCPGRDLRQAPLPELLAAPRELRWAPGGRAGARWPVPPMDVHLNTLKPRVLGQSGVVLDVGPKMDSRMLPRMSSF